MTRLMNASIAALALTVTMTAAQAQAGDMAATSELPPALAAMGVESTQVMTRDEAEQVRGEGLFLHSGVKANIGLGTVVKVPGLVKVGAGAKVNANVGVGTSLFGSSRGHRGHHRY